MPGLALIAVQLCNSDGRKHRTLTALAVVTRGNDRRSVPQAVAFRRSGRFLSLRLQLLLLMPASLE